MVKKEIKHKDSSIMNLLLENTIALQKTLVGLASDLKALNKKVSELYNLFETASEAFKEAGAATMETSASEVPQHLLDKINELVEQNKTIAKGLLLLEKALREKETKESSIGIIRPSKNIRKKPIIEEAEETEKTTENETTEEEYKPQPLPEFSF